MTQQTIWAKGIKRTKQRTLVLDVLENADMPVTALEISQRLSACGTPVWLSTIYRILDTFVRCDMVREAAVLEGGMAVYELNFQGHRHYAVCIACKKVIAMQQCPFQDGLPPLAEQNFHVLGHRLQMYGYCESCFAGRKT